LESYRYLARRYNELMADVDYDAWAGYIDRLLGGRPLRLFEAGCGTGSLTGRLYDKGHDIVASDISEEMLGIAMEDARRHGRDIVFVRQDMRQISAGRRFDAVVCACDGPNYLDAAGLEAFFSAAYQMLVPGGRLLFDISSAAKLRAMNDEVYFDDSDDVTCLWHCSFDEQRRALTMDVMLFVRRGERLYEKLTEQHVQYAHQPVDIEAALKKAGFAHTDTYEAFTINPASDKSLRIQFISRKE
jgi:SAM-dependent methyltransferase